MSTRSTSAPQGQKKPQTPGGGGFLDLPPAQGAIVDIGVNLQHKSFAKSLPAILQRAQDQGVAGIVITGAPEALGTGLGTLGFGLRTGRHILLPQGGVRGLCESDGSTGV